MILCNKRTFVNITVNEGDYFCIDGYIVGAPYFCSSRILRDLLRDTDRGNGEVLVDSSFFLIC